MRLLVNLQTNRSYGLLLTLNTSSASDIAFFMLYSTSNINPYIIHSKFFVVEEMLYDSALMEHQYYYPISKIISALFRKNDKELYFLFTLNTFSSILSDTGLSSLEEWSKMRRGVVPWNKCWLHQKTAVSFHLSTVG